MIASAYTRYAGQTGLLIYLCQVIGAAFSVQAITYLQHWGLTETRTPELAELVIHESMDFWQRVHLRRVWDVLSF